MKAKGRTIFIGMTNKSLIDGRFPGSKIVMTTPFRRVWRHDGLGQWRPDPRGAYPVRRAGRVRG